MEADAERVTVPTRQVLRELDDMINAVAQLDWDITDQEMKLKDLNDRRTELIERSIPDALLAANLTGLKLSDGRQVSIEKEVYANISEQNREVAHAWFEANGHGDLIKRVISQNYGRKEAAKAQELINLLKKAGIPYNSKESVNANTLKAWVRGQLAAKKEICPAITVFEKSVAKIS